MYQYCQSINLHLMRRSIGKMKLKKYLFKLSPNVNLNIYFLLSKNIKHIVHSGLGGKFYIFQTINSYNIPVSYFSRVNQLNYNNWKKANLK